MQAPINSRLGRQIGSPAGGDGVVPGRHARAGARTRRCPAGGLASIGKSGSAPWWALVGGLLGAFYVTVALLAVRTLGASGLTALVVSGQLAIAVAIDRFGLLGVAKQHIAAPRAIGLVLLLVGAVLVVRK